jgi:hypothetical protein
MKILILRANPDDAAKLTAWLESRGHAVVACVPQFERLPEALAGHDHDLVVTVIKPEWSELREALRSVEVSFADSYFIEIGAEQLREDQPAAEITDRLEQIEKAYRTRILKPRPFTSRKRTVFHDGQYIPWASAEKRHAPVQDENFRRHASAEVYRFVLQLRAANVRHEQARRYLRILRREDRGLRHEVAYRLAHGSYKIIWLREHLARWLTVLAHYIPGTELEHCPGPRNSSPDFVAIDWEMPTTYLYAVACARMFGMNEAVLGETVHCTSWTFRGQPEAELVQHGIRLYGICAYLSEVAEAQVRAFGAILDGSASMDTRLMRRNLGIVFEFQGFIHLWQLPSYIERVYRAVMAGEDCGVPENAPAAPSFAAFRRIAEAELIELGGTPA